MDETATPSRRRRGRRRAWVAAILTGLALAAGWTFRRPLLEGNFGVVEPGRAYRSAQPGPELAETIRRHALATVLNLRAGSDADAFYRHEVATTERLGVAFFDLPLSATRRPRRRELQALVGVIRRCRLPLLIHCKSGADRTGLASAVYALIRQGMPPERAVAAFSLRYGHVPLFGPQRLHDPIVEYAAWLESKGLAHTPERFERWIARDYRDDDPPSDEVPTITPGPRHRTWMAQPARAGSQEGVAGGSASTSSRVSTTSEATSQSSGISRR